MNITFLGLGIMGSRMANNLIGTNANLTVWNRSAQACDVFKEKGISVAQSASEAVKDADIVFSMLSNPDVVESLFFGESGLLSEMKDSAIWADSSTVNPSFSRLSGEEAEKHKVRFMDAPVAGSKAAAQEGQVVFFCGGNQDVYNSCLPFFEAMGMKGMHLGKVGQGASLKMLVNGMLAQNMAVFSETIHLGEKLGLDRDMLLSMLPNLPVIAPFTQHKNEAMRARDYSDVHFPLEHMHKDIRLATVTAKEVGMEIHLAEAARKLFNGAEEDGLGRKDFAAVHEFIGKV